VKTLVREVRAIVLRVGAVVVCSIHLQGACRLVQYHQYTDDLMIYLSLFPKAFGDLSSVVNCSLMPCLQNALLLNPDKTEAVIFGTCQRLSSLSKPVGVSVADSMVQFADAVKLLGVILDSTLTFIQHITDVVHACTYHTCVLQHIRPLLTVDAAKTIATAIFSARLDCCNSLLYGTS